MTPARTHRGSHGARIALAMTGLLLLMLTAATLLWPFPAHAQEAGEAARSIPGFVSLLPPVLAITLDSNIGEHLEGVNMAYRRARQEGITTELLDVVSGFEALTGSSR